MPFIAELDGDRVIPEGVGDGQDVNCIHCDGRMRARGPMKDGRARHFFHVDNFGHGNGGGGCEGGGVGESEIHRKYKSHAVGRLRQIYPDFLEFCRPEQRLSTVLGDKFVELPSGKEDRQADAMMVLEEPTRTFGRGLIVEVQYRNLGKNIEETTGDYLANGFSVLWVDEDDFEIDRCLLTKKQIRSNVVSVWPNAVPSHVKWGGENFDGRFYLTELLQDRVLTETKHFVHDEYGVPSVRFVPKTRVPATLPIDFFDQLAQDIKQGYPWEELFQPPEDYSPIWGYSKVHATLPPEWHEEMAREFWESEPWNSRFWAFFSDPYKHETPLSRYTGSGSIEVDVPLTKFLVEERERGYYRSQLRKSYHAGRSSRPGTEVAVSCNECGNPRTVEVVGSIDGMVSYGKTLPCEFCHDTTWHSA